MSFGGWGSSSSHPVGNSTTPSGVGLGSWSGFGGMASSLQQQQQQQQDEMKFNSLFPVAGLVTGEQVKGVFQASGLPTAKLAQIWSSVDQDGDGKISKQQFCSAMAMIRQAQEKPSPTASLPPSFPGLSGGVGGVGVRGEFSAPPPPNAAATPGSMSKSWSVTGGLAGMASSSSSSSGGIGQGWSMKPQDRGRYMMEFKSADSTVSGYLSGATVRSILTKSGLNQAMLAKIWELSDQDKDGRLSIDEYCIAMHLMTLVRTRGVSLPATLPAELHSPSMATKFHTIDRATAHKMTAADRMKTPEKPSPAAAMGSQSPSTTGHAQSPRLGGRSPSMKGHTRNTSLGRAKDGMGGVEDAATFEDKRKENFEAGRLELERRRRAIQEQHEKAAAEKERKKREEEERRLQQEREAELARQAELERQRRKAMEIEKEREEQLKKLAKKREEEERELELKRKAEWARKKRAELEGQRDREKKHLYSLRVQHSQLEDELRQLDQKKLGVLASIERQKGSQTQMTMSLRSMQVSHDVRRAEITKLQAELNMFHSQLSVLQKKRRELREAMMDRSPGMSAYQQQRQALKDRIISLAASLAGVKSDISHNSKTFQELRDSIISNSKLLVDLQQSCVKDETKVNSLRENVIRRQQAAEEAQHLEAQQRQEEARREKEEAAQREKEAAARRERDKAAREEEESRRRELRREQIRKEHEIAIKKARATATTAAAASAGSSAVTSTASTSPGRQSKPPVTARPPNLLNKKTEAASTERKNWEVEDDQVRKKVLELQKKKEELQRQRDQGKGSPSKSGSKQKGKKDKKKEDPRVQGVLATEQQLLDLNSSWDDSGQGGATSDLPTDMTQILQPLKKIGEEETEDTCEIGGEVAGAALTETYTMKEEEEVPLEGGVRTFSVSRLSQLFDKGLVSQQHSSWSSDLADYKPGKVKSPLLNEEKGGPTQAQASDLRNYANLDEVVPGNSTEDYVNLDTIATSTLLDSAPAISLRTGGAKGNSAVAPQGAPEKKCLVLYDYQAQDDTEVSISEGDQVKPLPRDDATPGWVMIQLADGKEGWVPQSYLEPLQGEEPHGDDRQGVASGGTGGREEQRKEEEVAEEQGKESNIGQATSTPSPTSAADTSVLAVVLFTWQGTKSNHLSLVKGEEIQVLQQGEKWWSGQSNGKVGWFPKTFVKVVEAPPQTTPSPISPTPEVDAGTSAEQGKVEPTGGDLQGGVGYEAIYEFVGTTDGDLSFFVGDAIKVISTDGEWWTGILNGKKGTFPSNYVQPRLGVGSDEEPIYDFPPDSLPKPSTNQSNVYEVPVDAVPSEPPGTFSTQTSTQSSVSIISSVSAGATKPFIARVVVAFKSTKPGQLNLEYGELVKVLKQAPNGWWEGEVQSRGKKRAMGWFPGNRVELLPQRQPRNSSASSTSSVFNTPAAAGGVARKLSRARSPLLEALDPKRSGGGSSTANLVLALYTYSAQSSDELNFHKGSVISVVDKEDGEWWKGEVNDKVGLFPSNYVQPLTEQQLPVGEVTRWADSVSEEVLSSVSKKERKKQEAIFELLTSERQYVDSLKLVKQVFFDPMAEQQVLTEEEMSKVKVNWDELIKCSTELLSAFLVRLRTSGEVVRSIGDVLVSQIPHLTPHIRWCSCQLTACTILQQKASDLRFKEFEQSCSADSRTGGLPLSSFLLKPMQRVTKYPLLIKRIVEYTASEDSDYDLLRQALEKAETLCEHVNDGVQQKDNTEKLEWLQSHVQFVNLDENIVFNSQTNFMGPRKLLHWGKFFKIRGSKDLVGFLFNDFLLLVKPKQFFSLGSNQADLEPWGKNEFQLYRKPYLLDGLKPKKSGTDANGALLSLATSSPEEKDILLRVDTENVRDLWFKKLGKASVDYVTTKKRMEREKQEKFLRTMRGSVGTLDVTVVEGVDLQAKDLNNKSDPFCVVKLGEQQEQTTPVINNNLNPKWNYKMQFAVHDINKDALEITVFDKDLFSPNDFLGCGRVSLQNLLKEKDSPWEKTLLLENVGNGEITLKIALTLNKDNLLL